MKEREELQKKADALDAMNELWKYEFGTFGSVPCELTQHAPNDKRKKVFIAENIFRNLLNRYQGKGTERLGTLEGYPSHAYNSKREWLRSVRKRWVQFRKALNTSEVTHGCIFYPQEVYNAIESIRKADEAMKEFYKNA